MPTQNNPRIGCRLVWGLAFGLILVWAVAGTVQNSWGQGGKQPEAGQGNVGAKQPPGAEKVPNAAGAAPEAGAGAFEEIPVDASQKKKESEIRKILPAGKLDPAQQAAFDTFYRTYYLARWTQVGNFAAETKETTGHKEEVKLREELRKDLSNHFKMAKSGPVHDHLAALCLSFFNDLAKGNYHPVVRYNAMLMIGDLNQVEAAVGSPPVPYPPALPVLLAAINDPKQIDAVKVAALRGILRHASLGIADAQARDAAVIPAMLQLASMRSTASRSPDGHMWMRTLAIDVLGALGGLGNQGAVVKTLVSVAGESDSPLDVRCAAARALGSLNYQAGPSPVGAMQMAAVVRELALDACAKVLDQQKKQSTPLRRRALKEHIHCVAIALEGIDDQHKGISGLATTEAQRTFCASTLEQLQSINDLLDNKDLADEALSQKLSAIVVELGGAQKGDAAAKAPTKPASKGAKSAPKAAQPAPAAGPPPAAKPPETKPADQTP